MSTSGTSAAAVQPADLARCEDEPIRVPGAIQPHGRMLVLSAAGDITAHSENWPDACALESAAAFARAQAARLVAGDAPAPLGRLAVDGAPLDVTGHRASHPDGPMAVFEFEPAADDAGLQAPLYSLARHFLPRMQQADSVDALCRLAAAEMKRLTGFGRCLVYRFDGDGHGQVLAEEIEPGYDSYAGHHFPASDIPAQARALYRLNHIRLIADATYQPVALAGTRPGFDARALDMSLCGLRSVSPVHLEYMRNMGTLASMSVSIVVRGELWGLISCHDHGPKRLGFPLRAACEHLGRLLAMQVQAREDTAEVAARLELRQLTLQIVSNLSDNDASLKHVLAEAAPLLRMARATGAAVVLDDECWTAGETPAREVLLRLAQLAAGAGTECWHTDALGEVLSQAGTPPASGAAQPAGAMAISISQFHRHVILWFRPEIVQTIQWAGEPRKEVRGGDGRIHPRASFKSWVEQVRGRSAPWSASETAAALELRQALIGIVLRRAEELASVAGELGRVNKELEAFSYTVSHDLRAPMRHIAGYVDLVIDTDRRGLSERSLRYLAHVKDAASFAGQLVDALLDFSRMGRSALKHVPVDTGVLVADLVREAGLQLPGRAIEWDIAKPLPVLWADPFLLQVAVRNLVANAIKYTRPRTPARIAVTALRTPEGEGLEISDNGVGFQMKYADKLFGVFQRLHQAEEFEGTGIGLASVRRIVERHGGTVRARGEPGAGAAFGFTLPPRNGAPAQRRDTKRKDG